MITPAQITRRADADGVAAQTVERDYVLAHVLSALARLGDERLVFKGGTAMRYCFLEEWRYSADRPCSPVSHSQAENASSSLVTRSNEAGSWWPRPGLFLVAPPDPGHLDPHHVLPRLGVVVARGHAHRVAGAHRPVRLTSVDRREMVGIVVVLGHPLADHRVVGLVLQRDVDPAHVEMAARGDHDAVVGHRPRLRLHVDASRTTVPRYVVGRVPATGDVLEVDVERSRVGRVRARLIVDLVLDPHRLGRRA